MGRYPATPFFLGYYFIITLLPNQKKSSPYDKTTLTIWSIYLLNFIEKRTVFADI